MDNIYNNMTNIICVTKWVSITTLLYWFLLVFAKDSILRDRPTNERQTSKSSPSAKDERRRRESFAEDEEIPQRCQRLDSAR